MAAQTRRNVRTAITQPPYAHTAGEFESIVSSRRLTALGWKFQPVAKGRMVNSEDWRTPSFYDPDYEFEREWVKLDGDKIIARQGDATWCTDLGAWRSHQSRHAWRASPRQSRRSYRTTFPHWSAGCWRKTSCCAGTGSCRSALKSCAARSLRRS